MLYNLFSDLFPLMTSFLNPWHYWPFESDDSLLWRVVHIIGSLASTHYLDVNFQCSVINIPTVISYFESPLLLT